MRRNSDGLFSQKTMPSGYRGLLLAMIQRAAIDIVDERVSREDLHTAWAYLRSPEYRLHCDLAGLPKVPPRVFTEPAFVSRAIDNLLIEEDPIKLARSKRR